MVAIMIVKMAGDIAMAANHLRENLVRQKEKVVAGFIMLIAKRPAQLAQRRCGGATQAMHRIWTATMMA